MNRESISMRRPLTLVHAAALLVLLIVAPGLAALDIKGRTDTGYQLATGDSAMVNRAFNYHSIDLGLAKGLTLSMYGGLLSAFGDRVNSAATGGEAEKSDSALRGLLDVLNGPEGTWFNYSLYSAHFDYSTSLYGLSFGRTAGLGSSLAPYDGLSAWVAPTDWLRIEAFGGLPWQDANVTKLADLPTKLSAGEFELGGGASASFMDGAISANLAYTFLSQASHSTATLGSLTKVVQSGLGSLSAAYRQSALFAGGASASILGSSALDASVWAAGNLDSLHVSYGFDGRIQPVDAAAVADRFDAFAALLSASKPYFSVSANLTEDIAAFLPARGLIKAAQLELACDYRQPLGAADLWNQNYALIRFGPLVALDGGFSVSAYGNYLIAFGSESNLSALGAEIRERIAGFDVRLGTAFDADDYETNEAATSIVETFDSQEYYLRAKWQMTKAFDLSLKASYSSSLLGAVTSAPADSSLLPTWDIVTTELNSQARTSIHLDLRAGFRY